MPLAMALGALFAWLTTRREANEEKPAWKDTSLDDWRRERDQQIETERQARTQDAELRTGSEREEEETQKQQRIGG